MADATLDSQVGARICNGLGIMRGCLETQKLEQLEACMDEIAHRVAVHPHMLRHGCGYALASAGHDTGRRSRPTLCRDSMAFLYEGALGEGRCFAHQSLTRSALIVSFGPTMRLTA
jgi:hypothetical protein